MFRSNYEKKVMDRPKGKWHTLGEQYLRSIRQRKAELVRGKETGWFLVMLSGWQVSCHIPGTIKGACDTEQIKDKRTTPRELRKS